MESAFLHRYIRFFALLCLFLNATSLFCQDIFTTSDILRKNLPSDKNLPYLDNLSFLKNDAKGLPLLENFQFRTEVNEFEFQQQEYLLRFNLNSTDERKAYDRILSANRAIYELKQEEYIGDIMQDVYSAMVDYYFDSRKLELVRGNLDLLRDRRTVLTKLISNADNVNINNWLSNQDDIIEESSDSLALRLSLENIGSKYFSAKTQNASLSLDDFITIEKIEEIVNSLLTDLEPNTALKLAMAQEYSAKAEYDLEKAETSKWLDFFQVRYQSDRDVSFQKELSFSSSINIPTKSTNRAKRNEAALKLWDRKYNRILEQEKINNNLYSDILKLSSAIKKYKELELLVSSQKLEETYVDYLEVGTVSPLVLLGLKENINKYQSKLLNDEENIYDIYVDILRNSALFVNSPIKNYLSQNIDVLKQ